LGGIEEKEELIAVNTNLRLEYTMTWLETKASSGKIVYAAQGAADAER
jgi:hypothetical protein